MTAGGRAFVGVGSNLDNPPAQVGAALMELDELPGTRRIHSSRLYRSKPMGPPAQPHYINAVAELCTSLEPDELLDQMQQLEIRHGRVRKLEQRWGPRPLDLDLLLFDDRIIRTSRLTIPHPGLPERSFVLYPLAEIAPALEVPGLGPLTELVARCPRTDLELLEPGVP